MNVVLSIAEINLLLSTKTAQENYVYVCEDGFLYKGQKNGQVQRLLNTNYDDWVRQRNSNQTLPYRNKTIEQGTRQSDGDIADVKVNDIGVTLVEVSKSSLPAGGATEAKQDTGNSYLSNLDSNLGSKTDSSASTDTGTFSLISLFKRLLQKNTTLISNQTNGNQTTQIIKPLSAFGDVMTATETPYVQSTAVYGFIPNNFRSYTSSGGSTGVTDKMFTVQSGTTIYGYGAIQSFRSLNYNAGQGGYAKFTGLFKNSVENSWTGIGLVNLSDELSFGYNGTTFGTWHRYGGVAEARTITVNVASSGSTNLTLTLDSVAYTIPLTAGTTVHNASEIAAWLNSNQSVWGADQLDNTVVLIALSDGAKSGTYTYSHATSTGTFTTNRTGVTKTSNHTPKASWNVSTTSNWSTALDPTKGNVFKIEYQYLGFGDIYYSIENPDTGLFEVVHVLKWANVNTRPSLDNPSLRFGIYAASIGSTTNLTIQCASVALGVQGTVFKTRNPRAVKQTQSVSTSFTNILTIRNKRAFNGYPNQIEIEPLLLSVSSESTKNVEIEFRTGVVFSGGTNFTSVGSNLVGDIDTTANTYTNGTLLAAATISGGGSVSIDLEKLKIRIPPTLTITVGARVTSGASSNVTAAFNYYEDL